MTQLTPLQRMKQIRQRVNQIRQRASWRKRRNGSQLSRIPRIARVFAKRAGLNLAGIGGTYAGEGMGKELGGEGAAGTEGRGVEGEEQWIG